MGNPRGPAAPLTFGQEQLVRAKQFAAAGSLSLPLRLPLPREVSGRVVASVLTAVIARHDALRMSIAPGAETQTTAATRSVEQLDCDPGETVHSGMDASAGPLFFSIDEGPAGRRATVRLDHLFVDGWAAWLLAAEFYARLERAPGPPSADWSGPAESFAAYARALRRTVTGERLDRHRAYWTEQLRCVDPLTLPYSTGAWRPGARLGWVPALIFDVANSTLAGFTAALRQKRASTAAGVLAAFAGMIARATGRRDLLLETAVSDRGARATRALIGCLTDRCPLRLRLPDDLEPAATVATAQLALSGALRHHAGPFQSEARSSDAGRVLSLSPRVSISFNQELGNKIELGHDLRPNLAPDFRDGPCSVWASTASSRSDLHVEMFGGSVSAPLRFRIAYRADLWEPGAVVAMGREAAEGLRQLAGITNRPSIGRTAP